MRKYFKMAIKQAKKQNKSTKVFKKTMPKSLTDRNV